MQTVIDTVNELQLSMKPILEERKSGIKVYEEAQDMYDNAILDALKDKQVDVVVEPADPYAEQRKWIGKLCRFWNFKNGAVDIGILKAVDNLKPTIPYINDIDCSYAFCEPVKPDDDIIYKGGDND